MPEKEQQPTVGRAVHYQSLGSVGGKYPPAPRAAVITQVIPDAPNLAVGLAILNPTGMFFDPAVPYSPEPKPGHWSWPPRT